jgi:hypothetical protein
MSILFEQAFFAYARFFTKQLNVGVYPISAVASITQSSAKKKIEGMTRLSRWYAADFSITDNMILIYWSTNLSYSGDL